MNSGQTTRKGDWKERDPKKESYQRRKTYHPQRKGGRRLATRTRRPRRKDGSGATNEERRTHPERINPMFALLRHLSLPCGQDKFSSWWPLSPSPEASTQVSTTLCFGRTRETLSWKAILQAPPVDISAFTLSLLMNFLMLSITPYVTSAPPPLLIADVYGGPHCVEHVSTSPVGIGKARLCTRQLRLAPGRALKTRPDCIHFNCGRARTFRNTIAAFASQAFC